MERYDDKWVAVVTAERMKLSKVEGQVWLTLYQLLLSEHCQQKYEYNDNNKITLLKVLALQSPFSPYFPPSLSSSLSPFLPPFLPLSAQSLSN